MVLFVALSIYLPRLLANPQYDFVYVTNDSYYDFKYNYEVSEDGLLSRVLIERHYPTDMAEDKIYLYNVSEKESTPISYQETTRLELDPSAKSPDGYEFVSGGGGGGVFPFFYSPGAYGKKFLKGHGASVEINLTTFGNIRDNYKFIGWVTG
jgi:hypothetical protein